MRAEAVVRARAEGEIPADPPVQVEFIRPVEERRVAAGRPQARDRHLPRADPDARALHWLRGNAAHRPGRREVAEELFHRPDGQLGVGRQLRPSPEGEEVEHAGGQDLGDGVEAAEEQAGDQPPLLLIRQRAPRLPHHRRGQIVLGREATVGEEPVEVVGQLPGGPLGSDPGVGAEHGEGGDQLERPRGDGQRLGLLHTDGHADRPRRQGEREGLLFAAALDEDGMAALGGDGSAELSGDDHQPAAQCTAVEEMVVMGMR